MARPAPIERAIFREAADGSTVFFPWGLSHRGYRLPDEAHRAKALRAASLLVGCTLAIGTWTAHRLQPLMEPEAGAGAGDWLGVLVAPGLLMAAAILGYALRVWHLVEGAQESDLRIPREEQLREAADLVNPRELTLAGVVLAVLSGVVVFLAPHAWWMGALGVAGGVFIVHWSHVLRRAKRTTALTRDGDRGATAR
jgi:hypothetical protein